nr:hypothetical protein [Candidatus Freyrarchaeum guaymaensis]
MSLDAVEALSKIPFILSGKSKLTPKEWCFILSFDWGLPFNFSPTRALKLLKLALDNGVLRMDGGLLSMARDVDTPPLIFLGKKFDFSGLDEVEPYPLDFTVEVDRERIRALAQREREAAREAAAKMQAGRKAKRSRKPGEAVEEEGKKGYRQTTLF